MQKLKIILLSMLLGQLSLNAQTFDVSIDTLFIDIKDIFRPASRVDMTHAVKFESNYYCFFEEKELYGYKLETKYFLIISDKGEILKNVEVPQEIESTIYFDFFIRNGSLFVKTYMDHDSFMFDLKKLKWIKVKEVDDRVYEDCKFAISYLNFGEWGQTTWFLDKQTKKEYVIGINGTTVNKINEDYYLTGATFVRKIENPQELKQSEKNYYYKVVEKERKFYQGTTSTIGSYTIYDDTTYSEWSFFNKPKEYIISSFVSNNKLYQLYSDSNQTYIGKIENHKLITIQGLGKKYQTYNWNYAYRGKNLDNNGRHLKFYENNNTFGFIEIHDNKIDIRYLVHNQDSLVYVGNDRFDKLLDMILEKPNSISMDQVENLDQATNGVCMKDIRSSPNGYHSKVYSKQKVKVKRFIKVENVYLAQETEYLQTIQDNLVKSVFVEWTETKGYNQSKSFGLFRADKPEITEKFLLKMKEIEKVIIEKTGSNPVKEDGINGYLELTWTLDNGLIIKLFGSKKFEGNKEIRMIIDLE